MFFDQSLESKLHHCQLQHHQQGHFHHRLHVSWMQQDEGLFICGGMRYEYLFVDYHQLPIIITIASSQSILEYLAKLQFRGTTSWYLNQYIDLNINNWDEYQWLIKVSIVFDKNINLKRKMCVDKWQRHQYWQKCQYWQKISTLKLFISFDTWERESTS